MWAMCLSWARCTARCAQCSTIVAAPSSRLVLRHPSKFWACRACPKRATNFRWRMKPRHDISSSVRLTLDQLHEQLKIGEVKELPVVVKADVQGSVEVLNEMLPKLSNDQVKLKVIHA